MQQLKKFGVIRPDMQTPTLVVMFNRPPTDNEMRALDAVLSKFMPSICRVEEKLKIPPHECTTMLVGDMPFYSCKICGKPMDS